MRKNDPRKIQEVSRFNSSINYENLNYLKITQPNNHENRNPIQSHQIQNFVCDFQLGPQFANHNFSSNNHSISEIYNESFNNNSEDQIKSLYANPNNIQTDNIRINPEIRDTFSGAANSRSFDNRLLQENINAINTYSNLQSCDLESSENNLSVVKKLKRIR